MLHDPERSWDSQLHQLLRALKENFPNLRLSSIRPLRSRDGFLLTGKAEHRRQLQEAFPKVGVFFDCSLRLPRRPLPTFDVLIRGVDTALWEQEIAEDLKR